MKKMLGNALAVMRQAVIHESVGDVLGKGVDRDPGHNGSVERSTK